jgi:hypothetical protein
MAAHAEITMARIPAVRSPTLPARTTGSSTLLGSICARLSMVAVAIADLLALARA